MVSNIELSCAVHSLDCTRGDGDPNTHQLSYCRCDQLYRMPPALRLLCTLRSTWRRWLCQRAAYPALGAVFARTKSAGPFFDYLLWHIRGWCYVRRCLWTNYAVKTPYNNHTSQRSSHTNKCVRRSRFSICDHGKKQAMKENCNWQLSPLFHHTSPAPTLFTQRKMRTLRNSVYVWCAWIA